MRYPVEIGGLNKGDVLLREQLLSIFPSRHSGRFSEGEFRLNVLGLKRMIENERGFKCRIECAFDTGETTALRVLTDSQAAISTMNTCDQSVRAIGRNLALAGEVDRANLTTHESKRFDHRLANNSRLHQALNQERRKITVENHRLLKQGPQPPEPPTVKE